MWSNNVTVSIAVIYKNTQCSAWFVYIREINVQLYSIAH